MGIIRQGDQYVIPIFIKVGDDIVTPENFDDVRVQIGNTLKEYSKGELTFNDDCWNYEVTEEQTRSIKAGYTNIQVAVKKDDVFIYSETKTIPADFSIIEKGWGDEL